MAWFQFHTEYSSETHDSEEEGNERQHSCQMKRLCPTCENKTLGQRKGQTDKDHEDVAEIGSFTAILHEEN